VRNRYTGRAMFEDEFEQLWSKQTSFRPELWTPHLREEMYAAIFGQRPLKPVTHLIGKCELEPDEQRAPRASWFAEQARLLQEVNNLKVLPRGWGEERTLTDEERKRLLDKLMTQVSDVAVKTIKGKVLRLAETESLNYEDGQRDKMQPNKIEARLRKLFGKKFDAKADWLRVTVWEALVHNEVEEFEEKAQEWGLSPEQIDALYAIERPKGGYSRFSLKALKKLLISKRD